MTNKPADLLFLLVLLSIPVQLGKFFFLDFSYVLGLPIDYLAAAIYLSDITVVAFIFSFIVENRKILRKIFRDYKNPSIALLIFNLYLAFSAFASPFSKEVSAIFVVKSAILSVIAVFAAHQFSKPGLKKPIVIVLGIAALAESLIIIGQFTFQKSLGLWILGERSFDQSTPLIAQLEIMGNQFLRPYGTFPHPNVAAAFLVFSLILVSGKLWHKRSKTKIIKVIPILTALVFTLSKTSLGVVAILLILASKNVRSLLGAVIFALAIAIVLFKINTVQVASIAERLILAQAALDISIKNPVLGVGSNNFILALSKLDLYSLSQTRLLQPVHNVFLLILTENGIIGLLIFTTLLFIVAQRINNKTKAALFIALLVFSTFDHFLWTIQQGRLLFFLALSYIIAKK